MQRTQCSWRHFKNVRTHFWRHFDSRSQVMAGKPGGILLVGYYPLDTAEYATAFQTSDWSYFLRHGIKISIDCLLLTPYYSAKEWEF